MAFRFKCTCIREPRGAAGLEGYNQGHTYLYSKHPADKNGRPYYRVWPDLEFAPDYYETCGPTIFHRYFEEQHHGN